MSGETGMPFSSASMIRSELRGVKVKVVRSISIPDGLVSSEDSGAPGNEFSSEWE